MSGAYSTITIPPPPDAPWVPPLNGGELDNRYLNCIPDLGPFHDSFPNTGVLELTIIRQDGQATTPDDLQTTGFVSLDSTGLIVTFGLFAPLASAGVTYILVLTANRTTQGRIFVRYLHMEVAPWIGATLPPPIPAPPLPPPGGTINMNVSGTVLNRVLRI
jgi:hypothetical protein